jgi:hypothetical protein
VIGLHISFFETDDVLLVSQSQDQKYILGKINGTNVDQRQIIGVTNILYLTFITDDLGSKAGFNLTYRGKQYYLFADEVT